MKKVVVSAVVSASLMGVLAAGANAFDLGDVTKGLDKVTKEVGKVQEKSKGAADKEAFDKLVAECQSFYRKNKIYVYDVKTEEDLDYQVNKSKPLMYDSKASKEWDEQQKKYEAEYKIFEKAKKEVVGKPYSEIDIKKYTNKDTSFNRYVCRIVFENQSKNDSSAFSKFAKETEKYEKK